MNIEEKAKDQEEIIDFYYEDKESRTKVLIHDKRKIRVALLEMEEYERKQKSNIKEFECQYNPKTDDLIMLFDNNLLNNHSSNHQTNIHPASFLYTQLVLYHLPTIEYLHASTN